MTVLPGSLEERRRLTDAEFWELLRAGNVERERAVRLQDPRYRLWLWRLAEAVDPLAERMVLRVITSRLGHGEGMVRRDFECLGLGDWSAARREQWALRLPRYGKGD